MHQDASSRSFYWDIVKGLGIIAIVLGHSGYFAGAFVYLFHLALFFFITGYFYNEAKYGDDPFAYFGARLSGAWPRYFFYAAVFVLLHNFFVRHGLYAGQPAYNHTMMLSAILSGISFSCMADGEKLDFLTGRALVCARLARLLRPVRRLRLVWAHSGRTAPKARPPPAPDRLSGRRCGPCRRLYQHAEMRPAL